MTEIQDNHEREQRGIDIIEARHDPLELVSRDDYWAAAVDAVADILHGLNRYGYDATSAHEVAMRHFLDEVLM